MNRGSDADCVAFSIIMIKKNGKHKYLQILENMLQLNSQTIVDLKEENL